MFIYALVLMSVLNGIMGKQNSGLTCEDSSLNWCFFKFNLISFIFLKDLFLFLILPWIAFSFNLFNGLLFFQFV